MDRSQQYQPPSMRTTLMGVGILLVTQLGATIVGKWSGFSPLGVTVAAGLMVSGLVAIAVLNLKHTPYPRWAYLGMVAIMVATTLFPMVSAGSPESWAKQMRESLWIFPSYLLLLSYMPPSKRRVCAPNSPYVGWLMVGTAVVLGVILQLATHFGNL